MGSMIEGRVFVLRASHPDHIRGDEAPKHYLSVTCEDIINTWGPGYFIAEVDAIAITAILIVIEDIKE